MTPGGLYRARGLGGVYTATAPRGFGEIGHSCSSDSLPAHCTKAIFFPIGKHATWEPGILKQVAAAGHAIGNHTWSHQDLSKKSFDEAKDEIEKGISAVRWAAGTPTAPYFRFPALRHPPELVTYLGQRNIGIFSTDFNSFDFKMRKPEQVRQAVLAKFAAEFDQVEATRITLA